MRMVSIAGLFMLISVSCFGQEFIGVPVTRIVTSEDGATQTRLSDAEMQENFVLILQDDDGEYIWATRNSTVLLKSTSGVYILYYAHNGAGYVKVNSLNGQYVEHVHNGLTTITYYGVQISDE